MGVSVHGGQWDSGFILLEKGLANMRRGKNETFCVGLESGISQ